MDACLKQNARLCVTQPRICYGCFLTKDGQKNGYAMNGEGLLLLLGVLLDDDGGDGIVRTGIGLDDILETGV